MSLDCPDIHRALSQGAPVSQPEMLAHLADCQPCADLAADGGSLAKLLAMEPAVGESSVEALSARLSLRLGREHGPLAWLRGLATPARLALALGLVALLGALALLAMPRVDLAVYPAGRLVLAVVGLLAVGGAAVLGALRPLQRPELPVRRWAIVLGVALGVPFILAALPQAHMLHQASLQGTGADFVKRALGCFIFGLEVGVPVLLLVRALDRGPLQPRRFVLAAALAGVAANLVLEMHCPVTAPSHLLAGHATVGLAFALVAVVVAKVRVGMGASARP
jgi:hypothetical protein